VHLFRFVCGSVDPGSVQAGVALRTLLGCGAAASTNKLLVLEQIQGSLVVGSDGPLGIGESLFCEQEYFWEAMEYGAAEALADSKRLQRTKFGGGEFVKSFPELPNAERRTSAEIDKAFEKGVQGKIKVKKALFEHAQDAITGAFVRSARTIGTRSTSKSSSSSAEVATRAAKRQAVVASRNMKGVESVLGGWQEVVDGLLKRDQVKNLPKREYMWDY